MRYIFWKLTKSLCIASIILIISCTGRVVPPNLVPDQKSTAPNYWCTWYWQNYLIKKDEPVISPDARLIYSNEAAREELSEESILGENGMARVMLPKTRGEFYFLIDHGWQDKSIEENTFFTMIMDTLDFPSYSGLEPKDRIKKLNEEIKDLGWRGLGLWVRGDVTEEDAREFVEWSKYAGIKYWKIDGGDTRHYYASRAKNEIFPELVLEHVTGAGPLTPLWEQKGLDSYPSIYSPEIRNHPLNNRNTASVKVLEILMNTDVVRTYDAAPLTVSTTTLQRIHDILYQTAGHPEYIAYLNIQDDPTIAAALGLLVAVKRHPLNGSRIYEGEDLHFQIRGHRRVGERLNEIDRMAVWQRIAAPMNAGYGTYSFSDLYLQDSIEFRPGDTWYRQSIGRMVHQGAPAIISRNIELPTVKSKDELPYVMASKFQNGSIAVATEGRVSPDESWFHPLAEVMISIDDGREPVGIFGYYENLTLRLNRKLNPNEKIWAQDLLSLEAEDISDLVNQKGMDLIIPGELITRIGTSGNDPGDISVPGMIIQILK